MVWMETFCFYCSVRLGVIISSIFSLIQEFVTLSVLLAHGTSIFNTTKRMVAQQQHLDYFILRMFYSISENLQGCLITFNVFFAIHIMACASATYGAFKLKKAYLMPYMISQFVIFSIITVQHIVLMIILKRFVNLGVLIGITLAGGFYILFIGYSWAAAVALFQIIILVNSQRYKELYGDDPMSPRERKDILLGRGTVENVKIFLTPNNNDISAMKRRGLLEEQRRRFGRDIIPVIPLDMPDKSDDIDMVNFNNWHWNELVGVKRGFG